MLCFIGHSARPSGIPYLDFFCRDPWMISVNYYYFVFLLCFSGRSGRRLAEIDPIDFTINSIFSLRTFTFTEFAVAHHSTQRGEGKGGGGWMEWGKGGME